MRTLMEQFKWHIRTCPKCRSMGGGTNALDCVEGVRRAEELMRLGFRSLDGPVKS